MKLNWKRNKKTNELANQNSTTHLNAFNYYKEIITTICFNNSLGIEKRKLLEQYLQREQTYLISAALNSEYKIDSEDFTNTTNCDSLKKNSEVIFKISTLQKKNKSKDHSNSSNKH